MAYTIDIAHVRQFEDDVVHLSAQRDTRLRSTVTEKTVNGKSLDIDRVGAVDAVTKASRHAVTPEAEVPHSRRRMTLTDKHWAEMVDKTDVVRMLIEPMSAYKVECAGAHNRDYDDAIISALGGTAVEVDAAGTESNVTFPAGQTIVHGSTGLTVDKLLQAREILVGNNVDMGYDDVFVVIGERQQRELLNDSKLTSSDYSQIQRLIDGDIKGRFNGAYFRHSARLPVATNIRDCFMYTKKSLCLGTALEMSVDVGPRRDRSNSMQIYAEWTRGAVRVEEAQVVKIECSEA